MPASGPTPTLAETALALVNIPSESRSEQAVHGYVAGQVPLPQVFSDGETLRVPVREGFEIAVGPGEWGARPSLAVPQVFFAALWRGFAASCRRTHCAFIC